MDIKFRFESAHDLLTMSGYGAYVWAAYGIFIVCFIGLVIYTGVKKRSTVEKIKRFYARLDTEGRT